MHIDKASNLESQERHRSVGLGDFVKDAASEDPFADRPLNVVLTFEGGGAKGIVHIGALREIERAGDPRRDALYKHWPRYRVRGVSGTSIGALVAALVAVGYTSEEIVPDLPELREIKVPPSNGLLQKWFSSLTVKLLTGLAIWRQPRRSDVLSNAGLRHVLDIFGFTGGRIWFFFIRSFISHPIVFSVIAVPAWIVPVVSLHDLLIDHSSGLIDWWQFSGLKSLLWPRLSDLLTAAFQWISESPRGDRVFFWSLTIGVFFAVLRLMSRGLFSTERLADAIDRALAAKLAERFKQLSNEAKIEGRIKDQHAYRERADECFASCKRGEGTAACCCRDKLAPSDTRAILHKFYPRVAGSRGRGCFDGAASGFPTSDDRRGDVLRRRLHFKSSSVAL
jgi:hypothetical protein